MTPRTSAMMESLLPPRYRVLRPLGRGGQGAVYLASDRLRASARVAVKVVEWGGDAAPRPSNLREEFLLLTRLAHPSIARVRDFGQLAGGRGAYFTSDYVPGKSLLEWAYGLAPEDKWARVTDVAVQALHALQYLSLRKVTHGDLKPANLLVEERPDEALRRPLLKVIDFGAARLRMPGESPALQMGTMAYLPPPHLRRGTILEEAVDLYGLGMSLFHAAAGRLPFPLGEPGAVEAWWSSQKPAELDSVVPDAPPALDGLIARLTDPRSPSRFRSAGEALEFLKARVSIPPPLRPVPGRGAWVAAYERFLEPTLSSIEDPGSVRIHAIVGPSGSGKTFVLEALEARLQLAEYRCAFFSSPVDPRGLRQAREAAAEVSGRPGRRQAPGMDDLAQATRGTRVAILVDDEEVGAPRRSVKGQAGPTLSFLKALASSLSAGRSSAVLVAASQDVEALASELGISSAAIAVHPLDRLAPESIRELAREFFAVETVPDDLVRHIARDSSGDVVLVNRALEALAAAGACADFLGHLKLPAKLPDPLIPAAGDVLRQAEAGLSPVLRRALGLFVLAGEPLEPAEAAARFPELPADQWHSLLEGLRARGILRREDGLRDARYVLSQGPRPLRATDLLGEAETARARELLRKHHEAILESGGSLCSDFLRAAARNYLALRDVPRATRAGLLAARKLTAEERYEDSLDMLSAIVVLSREMAPSDGKGYGGRGPWVARLRAAQAAGRLGRSAEALRLARPEEAGAPRWFEKIACWLRAEAHENMGELAGAVSELEAACGGPPGASGLQCLDLHRLDAAARLASLYFRSGDTAAGRACLALGRGLLEGSRSAEAREDSSRYARILGFFARAESTHGEVAHAMAFLEESLRRVKALGRDDLAWGPLNELAILYAQAQRMREASGLFEEIEAAARRRGDRMGILKAVFNRAVIEYRLRNLDGAETLFREARRISDGLGRHSLSAAVWLGFAGVLRERGRIFDALRLYRRVIHRGVETRPNDQAVAHNNVSELYLSLGRLRSAALHAYLGFRIARRTENKFLQGLTLRHRGRVRWALGDSDAARRDLERSARLASDSSDSRALGVALAYLGLLAPGDAPEALRCLRAAVAASRRAKDGQYVQVGTLAILEKLLGKGRRKAARFLLLRASPATHHWGTSPHDPPLRRAPAKRIPAEKSREKTLCSARGEQPPEREGYRARLLALRASREWPKNLEDFEGVAREAARGGGLWDAFTTVTAALEDPALSDGDRRNLNVARELMARRLERKLHPRRRTMFRRYWSGLQDAGLETAENPTVQGVPEQAAPASRDRKPSLKSWAEKGLSALGRKDPLEILGDIKTSLQARSVWLFQDPLLDSRPCLASEEDLEKVSAFLSRHAGTLDRSRRSEAPLRVGSLLFLRLPHPRTSRVLCVEGLAGGATAALGQLLDKATALCLALGLAEAERALEQERARHAEAREEVRRLNTFALKDKENLETAVVAQRLELLELRRKLESSKPGLGSMKRLPVAASRSLQAILRKLPEVAARSLPVLILGESGVGKDLLARCIHGLGPAWERPFLSEACNFPESLMEAELFGFVRGAFTGAVSDRQGIFQRASGGTIYLDEIADLAPLLQARLLRVLEEKQVRPLGASEPCPVEFRLISSSRRTLEDLRLGTFLRQDLFYRIHGEVIEVPPLRERKEDIPLLVSTFLGEYARETGLPVPRLSPDALERLSSHSWPGNTRELEHEIQRILVGKPLEITAERVLVPAEGAGRAQRSVAGAGKVATIKEERLRLERDLLLRALDAHQGNATRAARDLGVSRRHLGTLLEKHKIRLESWRQDDAPTQGEGVREK